MRASDDFIALPTELKISGVGVAIRAPLGLRYRPGEMFPLELHVDNPGPALDAELMAVEGAAGNQGDGDWGERAVTIPSPVALPSGKTRFLLPLRAPGVSAAITLVIRGGSKDGGRAELFRASLSRILRPLPSGGRVIVVCGGGVAPHGPLDQTARLSASELPAEGWMWESIDWVVLNDASIKDAKEPEREALRRWMLGGGRLFLGSREAFTAALNAHLLPLEATGEIGADLVWWEKNAGLKKNDVLATKNFRPVYARLRHGFGQIVFLFPGSDAADADGAAVFNRPDIQRRGAVLPDARVQPERFAAFAQAVPSVSRRRLAMLWSAIGALILCAALVYAHTSRSKLEAALPPFCAAALLAFLLARFFPQQELTVSRVELERRPADGACVVRREWALLEAYRRPVETSAFGPDGGTLAPRFDELDDLRSARLDRWVQGGRPALGKISAAPNQPAMLFASTTDSVHTEAHSGAAADALTVAGQNVPLRIPGGARNGMDLRRALWIRADGSVSLLLKNASRDDWNAETYSKRALETALSSDADASLAKARATALNWAVEDGLGEGGDALIVWTDAPQASERLISVTDAPQSGGNEFFIRTIFLK